MTARLVVPPAELAVSMDAARMSARASGTALDAEIMLKVQAITEAAEHMTGRAFVNQTWELTLDRFEPEIKLTPVGMITVEHVKFYDVDGIQRTLDPQDYRVDKSEPGWLKPAAGKAWPAIDSRPGAVDCVEVRFVSGYGPNEASVPAAIKQYILGKLADDYYPSPSAQYLVRLLDRYWVYL